MAVMVDELDRILSDFERTETLWVADFGRGDGWWVRRRGPRSYVSASRGAAYAAPPARGWDQPRGSTAAHTL